MPGQCVGAQKNGVSHTNRLLCFPPLLLLLLPLRSCLLTGALLSHCSIPGRCHYQPLTPPCASVMKTFSAAAAASGPCSSSLLHCFLQRVHPHHGPPLSVGSLWPHFGGKATHHHLLPSPQWAGLVPPGYPDPIAPQQGALQPASAQPWALFCMDGTAFGVMKYLQVSGFVRNGRDQSIPFQGVIFFPFMASVPC